MRHTGKTAALGYHHREKTGCYKSLVASTTLDSVSWSGPESRYQWWMPRGEHSELETQDWGNVSEGTEGTG